MLTKYLVVGRMSHEILRKENIIFHAHLILSEEGLSCLGFNVTETGKDEFELSNIVFNPEGYIKFNKIHKNRNEVLFFHLKFDRQTKTYSGSWESNSIADEKKGLSYLVIFEVDENVDFISSSF